jgi:hypothetical protein
MPAPLLAATSYQQILGVLASQLRRYPRMSPATFYALLQEVYGRVRWLETSETVVIVDDQHRVITSPTAEQRAHAITTYLRSVARRDLRRWRSEKAYEFYVGDVDLARSLLRELALESADTRREAGARALRKLWSDLSPFPWYKPSRGPADALINDVLLMDPDAGARRFIAHLAGLTDNDTWRRVLARTRQLLAREPHLSRG